VIHRGELHWVDLGEATSSAPAKRRPVLIVQADAFNASRLATAVALAVTSNTALAAMPGNVFLPAALTGLARDSVANVTALVTVDRADLDRAIGRVPEYLMREVDSGLRLVLEL
jgi:mRNA interferase MazF